MKLYTCYKLPPILHGNSNLMIEVWDAKTFGSDELVGRIVIDLVTRILSKEWTHRENKTIEWRNLWSPAWSFLQDKLEIFIEILTPALVH